MGGESGAPQATTVIKQASTVHMPSDAGQAVAIGGSRPQRIAFDWLVGGIVIVTSGVGIHPLCSIRKDEATFTPPKGAHAGLSKKDLCKAVTNRAGGRRIHGGGSESRRVWYGHDFARV